MERVGVVICNYNKADDVCGCIQSVLESLYAERRVYAVDNASTDDSVERIREQFGDAVTMIVNEQNLGGSGGFNTGIRAALAAGHTYIWCLDNDVLVDENALGELVAFLDNHPGCGMAGSRVDHMEAPDYVQQYGIDVDFEEFCVEAKYRNHPEDGTLPEVVYSDAVAACSVLVRSSLIRRIGMMPEDNFLYWDDTEWGMRCNLAGQKVASCGTSIVLHAMGAKKEAESTFPTYYAWRNQIDFFARYTPQEKLERMYTCFLSEIFNIQYEGMYNGTRNFAVTVMAAFDDAIHGVRGKAGDDRIFELEQQESKLSVVVKQYLEERGAGAKRICIEENGMADAARALSQEIERIVRICGVADAKEDCARKSADVRIMTAARADTARGDLVLSLCDFIFTQEDLSLRKYYVDPQFNILADEDDVLMVINYPYSKRAFFAAMLPLYRRCVEKLRKERGIWDTE